MGKWSLLRMKPLIWDALDIWRRFGNFIKISESLKALNVSIEKKFFHCGENAGESTGDQMSEESSEIKAKYKPNTISLLKQENTITGEQDITTIVFNPPLNMIRPLSEVFEKEQYHEDRKVLVQILNWLFVKSLRLLIGYTQASQKALEETFEEAFQKFKPD